MKVLITGINGFVGGYLSEYLLTKGIKVWGTTRKEIDDMEGISKEVQVYQMDIEDICQIEKVLDEIRPDCIFHLAAQSSAAISWKAPQKTMDANINGTINLLESIKKIDIKTRVILIGSSEEYGYISTEDIPIKESQPLRPGNPYAISKIAQSMMGQLYAKAYGMDIVIIRAFNHIGPKQTPTFVVSDFAKRIAEMEKNQLGLLLKVGNLEAIRDFTDVRDIVGAYGLLMELGKSGEIYNVGSGKGYKVQDILNTLLSLTRVEVKIEQDPSRMRPSDVPIIICDNEKLTELTNWKPQYSIKETLEDVLNYWRKI